MRKVHIGDQEWEYEVGKRVVVIYPPLAKKIIVNFEQLFGKEVYERLYSYMMEPDYEGSGRIPVMPSDVKKYITENEI